MNDVINSKQNKLNVLKIDNFREKKIIKQEILIMENVKQTIIF